MVKFINTKFDFNQKVSFSFKRVILLTIVLFSLGLVVGVIWYSSKINSTKPIELKFSSAPAPIATPTPVAGNIDNWQTYRNEEYGFEVKYPNNWISPSGYISNISQQQNIIFSASDESRGHGGDLGDFIAPRFIISVFEKSKYEREQVEDYINLGKFIAPTKEEVAISGIKGIQYTYYNSAPESAKTVLHQVEFDINGKIILLHFDYSKCGATDECIELSKVLEENSENIYNQIISTFKFTENNLESSAINSADLLGYWFTPHAATRNITFLKDNKFKFKDGKKLTYVGNFIVNGFIVTLKFSDEKMPDIVLKFSKDQTAKYLENNEGELFVK